MTGATTGGNVTRELLPLFPRNGRYQRSQSLAAEASEKGIEGVQLAGIPADPPVAAPVAALPQRD